MTTKHSMIILMMLILCTVAFAAPISTPPEDINCIQVCVQAWVIEDNTCINDRCLSSCAPDKSGWYDSLEECQDNIQQDGGNALGLYESTLKTISSISTASYPILKTAKQESNFDVTNYESVKVNSPNQNNEVTAQTKTKLSQETPLGDFNYFGYDWYLISPTGGVYGTSWMYYLLSGWGLI